jgi:DNA-binding beta-propeller fold protein YncE
MLALVSVAALEHTALGAFMYWAEAGKIRRAQLDGSGAQDVVACFPEGIALDVEAGKVYWTDNPPVGRPGPSGLVRRANLDGSGPEDIVDSLDYPLGIALEQLHTALAGPRVYWGDGGAANDIRRFDLGGIQPTTLTGGVPMPFGIALDVGGNKMYWTRGVSDLKVPAVQRANLDGSEVQPLVTGFFGCTTGLALDVADGKMFWGYIDPAIDGLFAGMIKRSDLDGSNIESVITGLISPSGIALDLGGGKIYWTDPGFGTASGKIQRANLDGSALETLIDGLNTPMGLALDLSPEPATLSLLALGGLAVLRRRGRK